MKGRQKAYRLPFIPHPSSLIPSSKLARLLLVLLGLLEELLDGLLQLLVADVLVADDALGVDDVDGRVVADVPLRDEAARRAVVHVRPRHLVRLELVRRGHCTKERPGHGRSKPGQVNQ